VGGAVSIHWAVLLVVLVVVLVIDLFARVFDCDYEDEDEDEDGRILVKAARDLGGISWIELDAALAGPSSLSNQA